MRWALLFIFVLLTVAVLVQFLLPVPAPIVVRPLQAAARAPIREYLSAWKWRIEQYVLHKLRRPKTISITTQLLTATNDARTEQLFSQLQRTPYTTPGIQAWLLNEEDVQKLNDLERLPGNGILSGANISLLDGGRGSVSVSRSVVLNGTNVSVGIEIGLTPRTRRGSTDLDLTILSTDVSGMDAGQKNSPVLVTNIAVAARVQLPQGQGFLILNENQTQPEGPRTGLLLKLKVKEPGSR
jgi:hypothetical protein